VRLPLGLCLVLGGCVLPEYSTQQDPSHSSSEISPPKTPGFAPANAECEACVKVQCADAQTSCGEHCADLSWPVSPSWVVSDEADGFASCVIKSCTQACDVTWGCVGEYAFAAPTEVYEVTLRLSDLLSGAPTPNVKVNACPALDPACSSGRSAENTATSDANGRATIAVAPDFFGYFLVDAGSNYYPSTVMWSQPTYRIAPSFSVSLFSRAWVDGVANTIGTDLEKGAGHIVFRAQNCMPGRYASDAAGDNVTVSYKPVTADTTRTFYTTYGFTLDANAESTQAVGGAFGGALNVPVGLVSITGSHEDQTVSTLSLRVRGDSISLAFLTPNTR
jgi:hypothetical protein